MLAYLILVTRLTRPMEAVVDFEQLCGTQNETVVTYLCSRPESSRDLLVSESIRHEASRQ